MSGHIFFADDYYGYDDAIYVAGRLLQLLSRTDKKLYRVKSRNTEVLFYSWDKIRSRIWWIKIWYC